MSNAPAALQNELTVIEKKRPGFIRRATQQGQAEIIGRALRHTVDAESINVDLRLHCEVFIRSRDGELQVRSIVGDLE